MTRQIFLTPVPWREAEPTHSLEAIVKLGPYSVTTDETRREFRDAVASIARGQNLLWLATMWREVPDDFTAANNVEFELVRYRDRSDLQGTAITWGEEGLSYHGGEIVGFRVKNQAPTDLAITVLFIDSQYRIQQLFPDSAIMDNNLVRFQEIRTRRSMLNTRTTGLEHVVLIAAASHRQAPPQVFSFLQEHSLADDSQNRSAVFDSPLGRLLRFKVYGDGTTRGISRTDANDFTIRKLSFRVLPDPSEEID